MAKKKKAEDHENLERWLVSYGDFITLLFATFVVLYALAQTDASDLSKLNESMQQAFSQNSVLQGQDSILDSSSNSIMDSMNGNSFLQELMTEYISPKYESQSFEQIQKEVEDMTKQGKIDGVDAQMTDQGLLLTFDDRYLFSSGSAELSPRSKKLLDKIGVLIYEKFVMHCIRVEGHTDSAPISSSRYPSNWELSSARACSIVRYLIGRFKFTPSVFTAVGYADTRPAKSKSGRVEPRKNRRVEILILKNKYSAMEHPQMDVLKMSKEKQIQLQTERKQLVSQVKSQNNISPAAQALMKEGNLSPKNVISLKNYAQTKGISLDDKELYNSLGNSKFKKTTVQYHPQESKSTEGEE